MKLGKEKKGEGGREEGCTKREGVDGRREDRRKEAIWRKDRKRFRFHLYIKVILAFYDNST